MSISYSDVLSGKAPYCHASGACFAKRESVKNDGMICVALNATYRWGESCPFQKERREITKGIEYPYNEHYGEVT